MVQLSKQQTSCFANNTDLLQALKSIADVIGLLESPYTTIASIHLAMIQLYNLYTWVKGNKFADHVKTCLTKCFEQYFFHSIFSISIFLWPQHWDFSLSKNYGTNWMKNKVIQLAILWNFTKSQCVAINQSLQMHIGTKENDFMHSFDPNFILEDKIKVWFFIVAPGHHDIQNERTCCTSRNIGLWYVLYKDEDLQPHECGKLKMFTLIRNDLARFIPDSEKSKERERNLAITMWFQLWLPLWWM